jgi:hypothetical protein
MHELFIFRNVSFTSLSECMSRMGRKKRHTRAGEEETETEDIYDAGKREDAGKEETPHTQRHGFSSAC